MPPSMRVELGPKERRACYIDAIYFRNLLSDDLFGVEACALTVEDEEGRCIYAGPVSTGTLCPRWNLPFEELQAEGTRWNKAGWCRGVRVIIHVVDVEKTESVADGDTEPDGGSERGSGNLEEWPFCGATTEEDLQRVEEKIAQHNDIHPTMVFHINLAEMICIGQRLSTAAIKSSNTVVVRMRSAYYVEASVVGQQTIHPYWSRRRGHDVSSPLSVEVIPIEEVPGLLETIYLARQEVRDLEKQKVSEKEEAEKMIQKKCLLQEKRERLEALRRRVEQLREDKFIARKDCEHAQLEHERIKEKFSPQASALIESHSQLHQRKEDLLLNAKDCQDTENGLEVTQWRFQRRRYQLMCLLASIYPITQSERIRTLERDRVTLFSIDSSQMLPADEVDTHSEEHFTALGKAAHVVHLCSFIFSIPLPHPLLLKSSRSEIAARPVGYLPLYLRSKKDKERARFRRAQDLLKKNLSVIIQGIGGLAKPESEHLLSTIAKLFHHCAELQAKERWSIGQLGSP